MTDPDWVTLFHGTSGAAVASIEQHGLGFVDLEAEVQRVATQFGLDPDAVRSTAAKLGYTEVGFLRSSSVSFAGHPIYAARYAGRHGGEARHEYLMAAWMLVHDRKDFAAAERWAFEQAQSSPMLVVAQVPSAVVVSALGTDRRGKPQNLNFLDREINLRIPRPIPAEWISRIEPTERPMGPDDVHRRFGVVPDLNELPPDGPRRREPIWWESTIERWIAGRSRTGAGATAGESRATNSSI